MFWLIDCLAKIYLNVQMDKLFKKACKMDNKKKLHYLLYPHLGYRSLLEPIIQNSYAYT